MKPVVLPFVALVAFGCSETATDVPLDVEPQFARGGLQLPSITGRGITLDNNTSGLGHLVAVGGFSARATSEGVETLNPGSNFPGVVVTRYEANGQVQARSVPANLGSFLATVVCIANLGPVSEHTNGGGGGVPSNDVWKIRIRVTKSSTLPVGVYGSIYVQDTGKKSADFAAENFDEGGLEIFVCGEAPIFQLEEQGSITVRD